MRRTIMAAVLSALAFGLAPQAQAAFDKGGVLGVGTQAMGMGGAYVAVAQGAEGAWWNPAGLVQNQRMEISGMYAPLLNGKEDYYSTAFESPFFDDTALGYTLVDLYHNTGDSETDASEYTFLLSFATALNAEKTVSVGVNLKYLDYSSTASAQLDSGQTIYATAYGVGMDLGALYQIPLPTWGKKLNFGFMAQDVDTTLHWQSGVEETVPLLLQVGTAYYPEENLVFTCDFSFFNDMNIAGEPLNTPLTDASGDTIDSLAPDEYRPHVGIEGWFFNNHLGLRAGYTGFATTPDQFTGGVSYKESWYGVDYAYMGHADYLGDSHRLSVHFDFGGPGERPRVVALVNPPTNVVARPGNNSVQLQWDANPDPHVTGYTVYMSKASGSSYVAVQKRMKENKVVIDGLTNGQRYFFVVTSVNNSWPAVESNYSSEVSTVPSPQIPTAPGVGTTVHPDNTPAAGEIAVSGWPAITGNVKGYNLYMSETSGTGYRKVNDSIISSSSYLVQGLDLNRRYFFVLTSVSNDNPPVESRPSQEWSLLSHPAADLPQNPPAPLSK